MSRIRLTDLQSFCVHQRVLSDKGYSITEETPQGEFVDEMINAGKKFITAPMRWDLSDLNKENSFWLALRRRGKLVGTAAGRMDFVDDLGFGTWLERHLSRYWCTEENSSVSVNIGRGLDRMTGYSVYMGDLFFRADEVGDQEKTFNFALAVQAYAFLIWPEARFLYVFRRLSDYLSNGALHGFSSGTFMNVTTWTNPPAWRSEEECLTLLTRSDFEARAAALAQRPDIAADLPKRINRSQREQAVTTHLPESSHHPVDGIPGE